MSADATGYDASERRETPLAEKLKQRIRDYGPICVSEYMDACLNDEEFGYYKSAKVIGQSGDFITSPEISQTFGELVGLWCVAVWQAWGETDTFNLVELGAGRGTLLADALRAARVAPKFLQSTHVYIAESSPTLRAQQERTLGSIDVPVTWLDPELSVPLDENGIGSFGLREDIPEDWKDGEFYVANAQEIRDGQTLIIANEFLDCLPVSQFVANSKTHPGWFRRRVGLDDHENLQFMTGRFDPPAHAKLPRELDDLAPVIAGKPDGTIMERRDVAAGPLGELYDLVSWSREQPHAALFVDYGHVTSDVGDTLQAVRNHAFEHPLASPGEADLTAQVDFQDFARQLRDMDYDIDAPLTQGEFLGRLGIAQRASKLMADNRDKAGNIETGVARLMAPTGMGSRFKVMGVRSQNALALPGFES